MHHVTPCQLIKSIRDSFVGAEQVYTQGSCVAFYKILKTVYPNAKPYWSTSAAHCITKIDGKYYDINGQIDKPKGYRHDKRQYLSIGLAVAFPQKKEVRKRFIKADKL